MIPKEKMAEIAKAVLNKLTVEEIKVSKGTHLSVAMIMCVSMSMTILAEIITMLYDENDGFHTAKTAYHVDADGTKMGTLSY